MGPAWEWRSWMVLVVISLTTILPQYLEAFEITVRDVECMSQLVRFDNDMVSGSFVVVDRRFDWRSDREDIEMIVTGPGDSKIMSTKARGGQKFQFRAPKAGYYKLCFFNPTSSPEKVEFSVHVGHIPNPENVAKDEHFDPLEAKIAQLREAVEKLAIEQQYYKARDVRHRRTNESTQNRLLWYTVAEYVSLIGVSIGQVYLIQRLFSKRIGYNKV